MKVFILIVVLIFQVLVLSSQTNYALYSIDETRPICIDSDKDIMYGVTWVNEKGSLVSYRLKDGSVKREFKSVLPDNPIKLMIEHPKKDIIYLITARKIDDTKNIYFDAIYTLNIKTDVIKLIYTEVYNYHCPYKVGFVQGNLIFTTFEEPTRKYNIKGSYLELLNPNTDYQFLSIAPDHKGYVMLNIRQIEADGRVPVCFMDTKGDFSDRIAFVNPSVKIYSKNNTIQLKSLTLESDKYQWVFSTLRNNRFPIYHFQIAMHPYWLKQAYTLDKVYAITALLAANDTYLVAKSGNGVVVYDYLEPHTTATTSISKDDVTKIEAFLNERSDYERVVISSDKLSNVFNAIFYHVYARNKKTSITIQQHGNYYELKHYSQLDPLVKQDFVIIDEAQSLQMEEALEVLYPVDTFNKKYVTNYKTDDGWMFIRGEAFGYKYGIEVKLDSLGKTIDMVYKTDL